MTTIANPMGPETVGMVPGKLAWMCAFGLGWRVVPGAKDPKKKHPGIKGWPDLATTDPDTLASWWLDEYVGRYVCVVTGRGSGIWNLDIDKQHGGFESLAKLEAEHGPLPETMTIATPSGGEHRIFAYPDDLEIGTTAGQVADGIDTRGWHGQFIAPYNAINGGVYRPKNDLLPVRAPRWLELLAEKKAGQSDAWSGDGEPARGVDEWIGGAAAIPPGGSGGPSQERYLFEFLCKLRGQNVAPAEMMQLGWDLASRFANEPGHLKGDWTMKHVEQKVDHVVSTYPAGDDGGAEEWMTDCVRGTASASVEAGQAPAADEVRAIVGPVDAETERLSVELAANDPRADEVNGVVMLEETPDGGTAQLSEIAHPGLDVDLIPRGLAYEERALLLSPAHLEPHPRNATSCSCPLPPDCPPVAGDLKLYLLRDECAQLTALIVEVEADLIAMTSLDKPKPRHDEEYVSVKLQRALMLMASGHVGGHQVWPEICHALGLDRRTAIGRLAIARAAEAVGYVEAPAALRFQRNLSDRHGFVCRGGRCGGRGKPSIENVRAVFEHDYRVHVAADDLHAVAVRGSEIGRAIAVLDSKNESEIGARLMSSFYEIFREDPGQPTVTRTVTLLRGDAMRAAPASREVLPVRAAVHGHGYIIDLGDDLGRFVYLDEHGWRVVDWREGFPVVRASPGRPLPVPERGPAGEDPRMAHLGFTADDPNWHQCRLWMATALLPDHEHQFLCLTGGSGSGKSKRAQSLASLVDPLPEDAYGRPVMGGPLPEKDEDLAPLLLKSYLFTSDNLTSMRPADSDRLCRIGTGYRFERRKLFTTGDVYQAVVLRPGLLTGITVPPQLQEDAQNRVLHLEFDERVGERRDSAELDRERREWGPRMMAALLDDAVAVLRAYRRGEVEYDHADRYPMVACAAALFGPEYERTRQRQHDEMAADRAESDPALRAVAQVLRGQGAGAQELIVNADELFDAVRATLPPGEQVPQSWPANGRSLMTRLSRNRRALAVYGVTVRKPGSASRKDGRLNVLSFNPDDARVHIPDVPPNSTWAHVISGKETLSQRLGRVSRERRKQMLRVVD